jgi:hypothetical protein
MSLGKKGNSMQYFFRSNLFRFLILFLSVTSCRQPVRVVSGIDSRLADIKMHLKKHPEIIPDPVQRERITNILEQQSEERKILSEQIVEQGRPWFDFLRWPLLALVIYAAILFTISIFWLLYNKLKRRD